MIAIVCGGRNYTNDARIRQILDAAVERMGLSTIIEGGATGADTLAREWALARGDVSVIEVPADWSRGKGAGHARNSIMLTMLQRSDDNKAVIAFPGGPGTANMVKIAGFATRGRDAAEIRIIEVDRRPRVLNRHTDAHLINGSTAVYVGR